MSDNDPEDKENELDPNTQLEKRPLQSRGIWQLGGGHMLHEQWKEQTFAASAAINHHRTDGMRDKTVTWLKHGDLRG